MAGYRVSVGTSPGSYSETYDVGSLTSFVYQAQESRLYYLAVASYTSGRVLGPLSSPVSAFPSPSATNPPPSNITDVRSFYGSLWSVAAPPRAEDDSVARARLLRTIDTVPFISQACWEPSAECLAVETLVRRGVHITSLAASSDGRLFFIEGGQRIVELSSNMLQLRAVAQNSNVRLSQIALDPRFPETRLAYVGEVDTGLDGSRDFRIVRYGIRNQTAERAVVVSLPLPFLGGDAVFAIGSTGHLYIAMPAAEHSAQQTESSGMLLRFNTDGTVPAEQRGSPVFATGYTNPSAVSFNGVTRRLWVAGVDELAQPSVSSLGERTSPLSLPATSLATMSAMDGSEYLLVVSAAGGLGRALIDPTGAITTTWDLVIKGGLVRGVASDPTGDLFIVVDQASVTGTTSSILRLASRDRR